MQRAEMFFLLLLPSNIKNAIVVFSALAPLNIWVVYADKLLSAGLIHNRRSHMTRHRPTHDFAGKKINDSG
jgi:hypothetical protein